MKPATLLFICGFLLLMLALTLSIPLAIAWLLESYEEIPAFGLTIAISAGVGLVLALSTRRRRSEMGIREGFAVVGLGWAALSAFGALPFCLTPSVDMTFVDAFFETMSGFTTTGASVIAEPESLPKGLLFWRSLTHWFGGMGIVVLMVAILPFLGAGGYQLLRAEATGPTAERLQPRIAKTAKILWTVYLLLTLIQTLLLWAHPDVELYDAACHAFGTLATGGFSTKNASIAAYDSVYVETVIVVFMIIAGLNFVLHYRACMGKGILHLRDSESRFYLGLICIGTIATTLFLYLADYPNKGDQQAGISSCFRYAIFQVVSIITTTGYVTADFDSWPNFCRFFLILLMVCGGCAGSTSGGVKCIRVLMLFKYGLREVYRIGRPHAVFQVRVGSAPVDREVVGRVMGFFAIYAFVFAASVLAMTALLEPSFLWGMHPDAADENSALLTASSCVLATLGNIGPGLAGVGAMENFAVIPNAGKALLTFLMLVGRLEIYAVVILLIPRTWRK